MRLILGQPIDKIAVESPIVFGDIKLHGCPIGGRGILGVMSDFYAINMELSMEVEIDALNDYPKFGCHQLISCLVGGNTKIFS